MPEGPSIITSRTSPSVSPTSAIRPRRSFGLANGGSPRTSESTHSAPSLVFPEPRPPVTSQRSGMPRIGYCSRRAKKTHAPSIKSAPSRPISFSNHCCCELLRKLDDAFVDPRKDRRPIVIRFDLLLLGDFFGALAPVETGEPVEALDQMGQRVDFALVDLAAVLQRCPARFLDAGEQHAGDVPHLLADVFVRLAIKLPSLAFGLDLDHARRTSGRLGD